LPIAIGQATKLIELMHTRPKKYEGQGLLGYATDSYDATGTVLKEEKLDHLFTTEEIQAGMDSFKGEIEQVPPIYSAVKVNGKHLYEYAREGIAVERPKRTVDIYDYLLIDKPVFDKEKGQESFGFEIECSKGTYVRSLVNDLGEKLGKPAVMTELRRTASSGFDISQAVKLSEIEANPEKASELIQPIDAFFIDYETIDLSEDQWKKVQNGAWIKLETDAKKVALRYNKKVKAIYENKGRLYCPSLMLLQNE
jgi:tRNA pseudouridine55 synthase